MCHSWSIPASESHFDRFASVAAIVVNTFAEETVTMNYFGVAVDDLQKTEENSVNFLLAIRKRNHHNSPKLL